MGAGAGVGATGSGCGAGAAAGGGGAAAGGSGASRSRAAPATHAAPVRMAASRIARRRLEYMSGSSWLAVCVYVEVAERLPGHDRVAEHSEIRRVRFCVPGAAVGIAAHGLSKAFPRAPRGKRRGRWK
jgi:hypothetical protein